MVTIEQLKKDIADYLKANNRYNSDDDVTNYIYQGAYDKLMKDKYGTSPFNRPVTPSIQKNDIVIKQEAEVLQSEEKEPKKPSMLSGGIKVCAK